MNPNNDLPASSDQPEAEATPTKRHANKASVTMDPAFRNAIVGGQLAHATTGAENTNLTDTAEAYERACADIGSGDLSRASNMLTSQALTLDAVFTELLDRASRNLGKHPEAMERYMRLALKAQAQGRASIESLMRMHQPREQTVRHIHVGPNGQAVFIENLHGGLGNVRSDGQAHAQSSPGAALLGHDAGGYGVPIPGGAGEAEMPNARRRGRQRRATGE